MLDVVTPGADAVLSHAEGDLLAKLVKVYVEKRPRNVLRSVYYEASSRSAILVLLFHRRS